ncbi:uncharacterized protein J3D65DRAFT_136743 [Phyllosticta citribraziliensis]|uniref:Uncharacterized protein n=1 Tax=Phyllosticta citribraziliensis TaxID=989973 RepID=A0ABR1L6B6_9PEZI
MDHSLNIHFNKEECNILADDGIFLPGSQPGKRKISGSFIWGCPVPSLPPDNGEGSSPPTVVSVCHHQPPTQPDLEIPQEVRSAAGLEFIGLTPDAAARIFSRWDSRPLPNPDDLIDYVCGDTAQLNHRPLADSDTAAMNRIGIAKWLQDAILDPNYRDIFQTNTLRFWLDKSLRANFLSLDRMQDQLKAYVEQRRQGSRAAASIPASLQTTTSANRDFSHPHVKVGAAEPLLEDHEVYYMATAVDEMGYLTPFITSHSSFDMRAISTHRLGRGDFNGRSLQECWYWTPELETATRYREYARQRVPASDHWIIRIQVSKDFSSRLNKEELFFSPTWGKYVWYCRNSRHEAPDEIIKYLKQNEGRVDIMVGHISTGVSKKWLLRKRNASHVQRSHLYLCDTYHRDRQWWVRINEENVMKIDGKKATQWVIMHEHVGRLLARQIRGKVHIDVYSNGWWAVR